LSGKTDEYLYQDSNPKPIPADGFIIAFNNLSAGYSESISDNAGPKSAPNTLARHFSRLI
jgi:hypothetical protein